VAATGLSTPKLVGALDVEGRQGILYERVEGPSMLEQSTSKPWLVFRLARQLADLHAEIHKHKGDSLPPCARPSGRASSKWTACRPT